MKPYQIDTVKTTFIIRLSGLQLTDVILKDQDNSVDLPPLRSQLSAIDGVQHVEYTQGTRDQGILIDVDYIANDSATWKDIHDTILHYATGEIK